MVDDPSPGHLGGRILGLVGLPSGVQQGVGGLVSGNAFLQRDRCLGKTKQ